MTTSNPFTDRVMTAAVEGYLPERRQFHTSVPVYRPATERLLSDKQRGLAESLLGQRNLSMESRPKFRERLEFLAANPEALAQLTMEQASKLIDTLIELPASVTTLQDGIPEGFYAVEISGELRFYRVERPADGKWAGYTFIKQQVSDSLVRVDKWFQAGIAKAIMAVGPRQASIRYGHELGKCGVCNRTLTNEKSRKEGIGPICAANSGW